MSDGVEPVDGGPSGRRTLPDLPASAGEARRWTATLLADRLGEPTDPEAADDVLLVVSELVANAVLHGHGPVTVDVCLDGDLVRVEVTSRSGSASVAVQTGPTDRPGGRGLLIVEAVSRRWGVDERDGAVQVWAEVALPVSRAG